MNTTPRTPVDTVPAAPLKSSAVAARRIPGLDGLRAFAVTAVILYHLGPGIAVGGYLGVDVFFVISGFLITGFLLREKNATGTIRLGHFWLRRARRLLPALVALLLVCCTAAWVIGGDVLVGIGRQVLGAATFSSNWLAITGDHSYFDQTAPELFRNLWSLAVEEQFYLVWPLAILLLVLVRMRRLRLSIVIALALASAVAMALLYVPGSDATRVYFGTDTHSFGLAIGAALALLSEKWSTRSESWSRGAKWMLPSIGTLAVAALIAAAILMPAEASFVYQGGLVAVAVLTAIAILGSIVPGSALGRVLDIAPLRWIGERSYGLYLWHWPVFILVTAALPTWPRVGLSGWGIGGIALVITVLASVASYRFIEQPIRHRGFRASVASFFTAGHRPPASAAASKPRVSVPPAPNQHRTWPRVVGAIAGVLLVAATGAGTAAALTQGPGKSDAEASIEQGQAAIDKQHSAPAETAEPTPSPTPEPSTAPPTAPPLPGGSQMAAIGDSVMLASAPGLQAAFPGIEINAVVSRQMSQLPAILRGMQAKGQLRPIMIVGLGTNGPITRATLDEARQAIGAKAQLVLVNVQAPRGWTAGVDSTLTLFAQQYRDVELANWRGAISGKLSLLAPDQIHPGTRGGVIYASAIKDALQRLAELPPLLGPNQYGLAATPL